MLPHFFLANLLLSGEHPTHLVMNYLPQCEMEKAACALDALCAHGAAMIVYDHFNDGKSQPAPSLGGISGIVCPVKPVKNMGKVLGGDSWTVIFDFYSDKGLANFLWRHLVSILANLEKLWLICLVWQILYPHVNVPIWAVVVFDHVFDQVLYCPVQLLRVNQHYCGGFRVIIVVDRNVVLL